MCTNANTPAHTHFIGYKNLFCSVFTVVHCTLFLHLTKTCAVEALHYSNLLWYVKCSKSLLTFESVAMGLYCIIECSLTVVFGSGYNFIRFTEQLQASTGSLAYGPCVHSDQHIIVQ